MPSSPALKSIEATTSSNSNELRRLSTFLEISQTLAAATNQKTALHQVLGILERHHGAVRSTIALLNQTEEEIEVVAAEGPGSAKADVRFRPGEGITGRVVQSGKPIVVPRVSREPMFLGRTSERPGAAEPRNQLRVRADPAEPQSHRRAGRRFPLQGRSRFRSHGEVPRRRGVARGAGDPHPARDRRRARPAARGKHPPRSSSCASATTSRTCSAPAGPCAWSTSRWRRWRAPTPRC